MIFFLVGFFFFEYLKWIRSTLWYGPLKCQKSQWQWSNWLRWSAKFRNSLNGVQIVKNTYVLQRQMNHKPSDISILFWMKLRNDGQCSTTVAAHSHEIIIHRNGIFMFHGAGRTDANGNEHWAPYKIRSVATAAHRCGNERMCTITHTLIAFIRFHFICSNAIVARMWK